MFPAKIDRLHEVIIESMDTFAQRYDQWQAITTYKKPAGKRTKKHVEHR